MANSQSLDDAAKLLAAALREGGQLSAETARELFTAGVHAYSQRRQDGESGSPLCADHGLAATDIALITTAMLEDVNIAIFELGLWQTMGGKQ